MLSKCANPACSARFRYLHQGRVFNIETSTISSESKGPPIRKIEHFWLCARCVQTLEVVLQNGIVTTRSLHMALAEGDAKEKSEGKRHVA